MNNPISFFVGILIVIGVGGLVFYQTQGSNRDVVEVTPISDMTNTSVNTPPAMQLDDDGEKADDNTLPSNPPVTGGTPPAGSGMTLSVIARHSTRTDCWSAINGAVYDLTSWVPKHPGGEGAILKLCGTDGSASFNRQHGGAAAQAKILAGFKIGALSQ